MWGYIYKCDHDPPHWDSLPSLHGMVASYRVHIFICSWVWWDWIQKNILLLLFTILIFLTVLPGGCTSLRPQYHAYTCMPWQWEQTFIYIPGKTLTWHMAAIFVSTPLGNLLSFGKGSLHVMQKLKIQCKFDVYVYSCHLFYARKHAQTQQVDFKETERRATRITGKKWGLESSADGEASPTLTSYGVHIFTCSSAWSDWIHKNIFSNEAK